MVVLVAGARIIWLSKVWSSRTSCCMPLRRNSCGAIALDSAVASDEELAARKSCGADQQKSAIP